uniref:mRNA export factor GLE1 n=1 Tax=Romanomermis culicivorax TaxID=13658 RepID=A0A915JVF7_ROMCU
NDNNYVIISPEKKYSEIPSAYQSPVLNDYIEKLTAHENYWADVMKERAYHSQQDLKLKYRLHMGSLVEKMEKLVKNKEQESFDDLSFALDHLTYTFEETMKSSDIQRLNSNLLQKARQILRADVKVPEIYADSVTPVAYKEFCDALKVLNDLESVVEEYIRQPSIKNSLVIITQSVTNLVNQVAGANFLPSFARMVKLLRGDQIEISRRYVCLRNNPAATSFCINFMCKRILQGVVNNLKQSDSPSSVYNFAAFCVGICSYFSEVQPILMAHLYLKCPMLIPMYVKTIENAGAGRKSLETIKDNIELTDEGRPKLTEQELQPIVAYAQFYATLFIVPPPQAKVSSFKIQTLWNLLQSIVKLPPRFQYTAIVLNEVLKTAGFILWPKFHSLFQDFLKTTRRDFVPKIENANCNFNVGAFVDLIRYLETGDFKKQPRGYLGASIWIPPPLPPPV